MKFNKKYLKYFIITILIVGSLFFASCNKVKITDIFDDAGLTQENMNEWNLEISYINETRGTGNKIYSPIQGSTNEFIEVVNIIYGGTITNKPSYIFSAEAMCEYKIDFYHNDKDSPAITFYYLKGENSNLLTYVTKLTDEDGTTKIDYAFYSPYGDLGELLQKHRLDAIVPKDELAISFVSRPEMISSISYDEIDYFVPEAELENEDQNTDLPFEFYEGTLPDDRASNAQLYSNNTVSELQNDHYLIIANRTNDIGDIEGFNINEVRFNDNYTLVFVDYPDMEILSEFGLTPNNAITMSVEDLPLDRWIVFLDPDDNIVDVIDPELELR